MDILIIGGREFLGRHIVNSCLKKNHKVTLFNRGQTNSHLYQDIETIIGNRYSDLKKLENRQWDVVIDTCGYDPKNLVEVARVLDKKTNHYIYISSCSVYNQRPSNNVRNESAEIRDIEVDFSNLDPFGKDYGACKYLSERAIDDSFKNGLTTHIRAGLIVGPYDTTSRFPYWVEKLKKGGSALAPPENYPTKFIDARDLAEWCVHIFENNITGIFNASGPSKEPITIKQFLDQANDTLGGKSKLYYSSENFLTENGVQCWTELPLWVVKEVEAFILMDSKKAIEHGLKFRSIRETIKDTLDWIESENIKLSDLKYSTISSEKEKRVLERHQAFST